MPNSIIDEKYLNSVCKVRSMENVILTMGHIIEITDSYITVQNEPELPSIIHYNKKVKLSILSDKHGYKTLVATVYTSTTKILKLFDLKEVSNFEKRTYFRLNVTLNGIITYPVEAEAKDPSQCVSHKVEVENVSLSGVLFTSTFEMKMNDRLSVSIFTPYGKMDFICMVRRIAPAGDLKIRYGCEFDKYPEKAGDALWKYMMIKEREDIRKAKGGWGGSV